MKKKALKTMKEKKWERNEIFKSFDLKFFFSSVFVPNIKNMTTQQKSWRFFIFIFLFPVRPVKTGTIVLSSRPLLLRWFFVCRQSSVFASENYILNINFLFVLRCQIRFRAFWRMSGSSISSQNTKYEHWTYNGLFFVIRLILFPCFICFTIIYNIQS